MGEIIVRRLTHPTDDEIERGSAVLSEAFENAPDTFSDSLVGGNRLLLNPLQRAHITAGAIGGEVWVAGFGPDDISAVAVWFGPGEDFLGSKEQQEAGWNDVYEQFTPELKKWWSDYFLPKYNAFTESSLGKGTKHDSWQLQLLGTKPDCQQKGLATALIKFVRDKADKEGVMMCLETTNDINVAFYEHLGFVLRGTLALVGSHGEVTMSCLSRSPDQVSHSTK